MWKSALKFVVILFLKNRAELVRRHFFNKLNTNSSENLNQLKLSIAAMAESRAAIFKQNFHFEIKRIVNSLFGFMLILLTAMLSLLTGLMWLFATAWVSPYRDIILGITMILPLLIATGVYLYIRRSWQKKPIFQQSILQVESDWQVFRAGLDGTADTSDEANR